MHPSWLSSWVGLNESFVKANLVPEGPLKDALDTIFLEEYSQESPEIPLERAGANFIKKKDQIVATHSSMEGWILKALPYANSYKVSPFSDTLNLGRVLWAKKIQHLIEKKDLGHLMVPKKYLYHIPGRKQHLSDANYIVVAQWVDVVDQETNMQLWKNVTEEQEKEIICIIKKMGFLDATFDNIRFTTDGEKLAFIDTEPRWLIPFIDAVPLLSHVKKWILIKKGMEKLRHLRDVTSAYFEKMFEKAGNEQTDELSAE